MWYNFRRGHLTVGSVAILQIYNWLRVYRGTHFQPVLLRLAPAGTFTRMHTGKEVHCWVKLCYCCLDADKGQLIKIEEQYNSLLRCLPGKTFLPCQFMDEDDTQTGGDRMIAVLLQMANMFNWCYDLRRKLATCSDLQL